MSAGTSGAGAGFPGAEATGGFEPPDMGAEKQTQVLWESSMCF